MCNIDLEPVEWSATRMVTCRTEHKCMECRRVIDPRERAQYERWKMEGDFYAGYCCLHCLQARACIVRYCGMYAIEGTLEELREHKDSGYPWEPLMLRFADAMEAKWRTSGALMTVPDWLASGPPSEEEQIEADRRAVLFSTLGIEDARP